MALAKKACVSNGNGGHNINNVCHDCTSACVDTKITTYRDIDETIVILVNVSFPQQKLEIGAEAQNAHDLQRLQKFVIRVSPRRGSGSRGRSGHEDQLFHAFSAIFNVVDGRPDGKRRGVGGGLARGLADGLTGRRTRGRTGRRGHWIQGRHRRGRDHGRTFGRKKGAFHRSGRRRRGCRNFRRGCGRAARGGWGGSRSLRTRSTGRLRRGRSCRRSKCASANDRRMSVRAPRTHHGPHTPADGGFSPVGFCVGRRVGRAE